MSKSCRRECPLATVTIPDLGESLENRAKLTLLCPCRRREALSAMDSPRIRRLPSAAGDSSALCWRDFRLYVFSGCKLCRFCPFCRSWCGWKSRWGRIPYRCQRLLCSYSLSPFRFAKFEATNVWQDPLAPVATKISKDPFKQSQIVYDFLTIRLFLFITSISIKRHAEVTPSAYHTTKNWQVLRMLGRERDGHSIDVAPISNNHRQNYRTQKQDENSPTSHPDCQQNVNFFQCQTSKIYRNRTITFIIRTYSSRTNPDLNHSTFLNYPRIHATPTFKLFLIYTQKTTHSEQILKFYHPKTRRDETTKLFLANETSSTTAVTNLQIYHFQSQQKSNLKNQTRKTENIFSKKLVTFISSCWHSHNLTRDDAT